MLVPQVDVDAFAAARADGASVIDVREPHEYVTGHVPGAQLVPFDRLQAQIPYLPAGRRLFVVCESGARSRSAAQLLHRAGVPAVIVTGGTAGWRSGGRPVVYGPRATA